MRRAAVSALHRSRPILMRFRGTAFGSVIRVVWVFFLVAFIWVLLCRCPAPLLLVVRLDLFHVCLCLVDKVGDGAQSGRGDQLGNLFVFVRPVVQDGFPVALDSLALRFRVGDRIGVVGQRVRVG